MSKLRGLRVLSLALNLPGPAGLSRLRAMGAKCTKLEPLPPPGVATVDPLGVHDRRFYDELHEGVKVVTADLKTETGQAVLHRHLAKTDVLVTSFRPKALRRLGLTRSKLQLRFPSLSVVSVVSAPGARAEEPGHDLTYLAEAGLLANSGLTMPPSLFADMAGAVMVSEAVLRARVRQLSTLKSKGVWIEVALSEAAQFLALPRKHKLMSTVLGGQHAGYKIYCCIDGRVALTALEPHFAAALQAQTQAPGSAEGRAVNMLSPSAHQAVASWAATKTRQEIQKLAEEQDIPLCCIE